MFVLNLTTLFIPSLFRSSRFVEVKILCENSLPHEDPTARNRSGSSNVNLKKDSNFGVFAYVFAFLADFSFLWHVLHVLL